MVEREPCEKCGERGYTELWGPCCMDSRCSKEVEEEIKKAVEAERERCARIVDSGVCGCPPPGCYDAVCSLNKMAELIRGV